MKKLKLYKSASDFAFATLDATPFELDQKLPAEFQSEGFDQADYDYWKSQVLNCRQNFTNLSTQNAPSVRVAKPVAAPLAAGTTPAASATTETP